MNGTEKPPDRPSRSPGSGDQASRGVRGVAPPDQQSSPHERLLRADAERNRQRILAAAADVFTERGFEATLDEVARRAGVGVGTVYRRFPDKAALAEALFTDRIDALVALAERAQREPDAWAALVTFLEQAAEMLASDRGLRQLLMYAAAQGYDRVEYARDRMRPAVDCLVKRAQAEGRVRGDLAATDIPLIEFMLGAAAEYTRYVRPGVWRRYLALILDALGPARAGTSVLPEPELSPAEMVEVLNSNPLGQKARRKHD
jgi:AcrR family transcriptional regulator